jgi:hypothetical protein
MLPSDYRWIMDEMGMVNILILDILENGPQRSDEELLLGISFDNLSIPVKDITISKTKKNRKWLLMQLRDIDDELDKITSHNIHKLIMLLAVSDSQLALSWVQHEVESSEELNLANQIRLYEAIAITQSTSVLDTLREAGYLKGSVPQTLFQKGLFMQQPIMSFHTSAISVSNNVDREWSNSLIKSVIAFMLQHYDFAITDNSIKPPSIVSKQLLHIYKRNGTLDVNGELKRLKGKTSKREEKEETSQEVNEVPHLGACLSILCFLLSNRLSAIGDAVRLLKVLVDSEGRLPGKCDKLRGEMWDRAYALKLRGERTGAGKLQREAGLLPPSNVFFE